jgi:hypothetical protein
MKLTYCYVRHRRFSQEQLQTDGHYTLIQELAKRGLIESAEIVLENYTAPAPAVLADLGRVQVIETPRIETVTPGDIIWVRGSWKPWIPWLEKHAPTRWLIYYAANTGRGNWPWWDVVLWDLGGGSKLGQLGKLWWTYVKTVAPGFRNLDHEEKYDVCVGASHIYDRKGQYRILPIAKRFRELAGRDLKVIMPGSFYCRERQTQAMKTELLAGKWPNITVTGWRTRAQMVDVYNQSRWFYAATCGGQGDRCVMEAGMCGCRQIIGLPKNHAPYTYETPWVSFVPSGGPDDFESIAQFLAGPDPYHPTRREVAAYFRRFGGMDAAVESLRPLLAHMSTHKKDRETLRGLL